MSDLCTSKNEFPLFNQCVSDKFLDCLYDKCLIWNWLQTSWTRKTPTSFRHPISTGTHDQWQHVTVAVPVPVSWRAKSEACTRRESGGSHLAGGSHGRALLSSKTVPWLRRQRQGESHPGPSHSLWFEKAGMWRSLEDCLGHRLLVWLPLAAAATVTRHSCVNNW